MSGARLALRRLDANAAGFDGELAALTAFESAQDPAVDATVARIVADVRARGDAALLEYTAQFDGVAATSVAALEITAAEMERAFAHLPEATRAALGTAAARIRAYHDRQKLASWSFRDPDGSEFGQKVTPLDRVGIYVPGGKAAYPSSVLMNAIPAAVAGVPAIVMVVPTPGGMRNPLVLAAAHLAGVSRVFAIGGAQAIAALAYGTATICPVDKICGPGNAYVAAAKRRVFGTVGIDMIAGASEVLVIADASANADWVAMDLFAQAEHDELAQAILVSPDAALLDAVAASAQRQLAEMPRARDHRGVARPSRRAHQGAATSTTPARSRIVSRPSTWSSQSTILPRCCRRSATPARYSWGTTRRKPSATIAPGPTTFCRRAARRGFPRRSASTTSRSARACSTSRMRPRAALGPVAATLAHGEGLFAHARRARLYRTAE